MWVRMEAKSQGGNEICWPEEIRQLKFPQTKCERLKGKRVLESENKNSVFGPVKFEIL